MNILTTVERERLFRFRTHLHPIGEPNGLPYQYDKIASSDLRKNLERVEHTIEPDKKEKWFPDDIVAIATEICGFDMDILKILRDVGEKGIIKFNNDGSLTSDRLRAFTAFIFEAANVESFRPLRHGEISFLTRVALGGHQLRNEIHYPSDIRGQMKGMYLGQEASPKRKDYILDPQKSAERDNILDRIPRFEEDEEEFFGSITKENILEIFENLPSKTSPQCFDEASVEEKMIPVVKAIMLIDAGLSKTPKYIYDPNLPSLSYRQLRAGVETCVRLLSMPTKEGINENLLQLFRFTRSRLISLVLEK